MNKENNTLGYKQRYVGFAGLDNKNDPVRFTVDDGVVKLSKAVNINCTRQLIITRRDGYSLWKSGNYSSLWSNGSVCYAADDKSISSFSLVDGSESIIKVLPIGEYPLKFVDSLTGYVYFTNGVIIGKIKDDVVYDLNTSSDKFKATLPPGQIIEYLSPRIIIAKGNVIYISDPVNKDVYHQHSGFLQFDSEIRMIAPMPSGNMFVSDSSKTWYLEKMESSINVPTPLFRLKKIADYPAISGNPVSVVTNIKTELAYYAYGAMWASENGICIGGADGMFENITDKKYTMPTITKTAYTGYRVCDKSNLFISVIKGVK